MQDKTPIQTAIEYWKERQKEAGTLQLAAATRLFIDYLESMSEDEKEFVGEIFQAGADWATEVLDSYLKRPKVPDRDKLINQLYPEK